MEQPTPAQALNTIDGAVAQISASREGHIVLQQAIAILREAIAPKVEEVPSDEA